jgi:hypothetical protein
VESLKGASLGQAQALEANIRLGWKALPGTNTIAYLAIREFSDEKSFVTLILSLLNFK